MNDCLLEPCTLQHNDLACGESLSERSLCAPLLQIHAHYELKKSSRHRRNLAITGGVALSIITAPVIAAVSVGKNSQATNLSRFPFFHPGLFTKCSSLSPGIGVPIMLAYVYGVVPISLCRGGGCGVSRGKGRGVRIDFDEDDGPITGERRAPLRKTPLPTTPPSLCLNIDLNPRSGGRVASAQVAEPRREQPGRGSERPQHHLPQRGSLRGARDAGRNPQLQHAGRRRAGNSNLQVQQVRKKLQQAGDTKHKDITKQNCQDPDVDEVPPSLQAGGSGGRAGQGIHPEGDGQPGGRK